MNFAFRGTNQEGSEIKMFFRHGLDNDARRCRVRWKRLDGCPDCSRVFRTAKQSYAKRLRNDAYCVARDEQHARDPHREEFSLKGSRIRGLEGCTSMADGTESVQRLAARGRVAQSALAPVPLAAKGADALAVLQRVAAFHAYGKVVGVRNHALCGGHDVINWL